MQGWTRRLAGDLHVSPDFIEGRVETEFNLYKEDTQQFSQCFGDSLLIEIREWV